MKKTKIKAIAKVKEQLAEKAAETTSTWTWLKTKWAQFETWFQTTYWPGMKTRLALYATFIGSTAATLKDSLPNLPLDKYVSSTTLGIVTMVLALLALWFNKMRTQVDERIEELK